MRTQLFRKNLSPREFLAIQPSALELMFNINSIKPNEMLDNGICIVSICGPLEHHESIMWDSYDNITRRVEEAFADSDCRCVVMCIDSPGGDAAGCTEAHRQIKRLRKQYKKPIFAYSNEAMYSAAYSIGSAADKIFVPETGGVGSVGVICPLLDKTKANEMAGLNIKLLTTGARKADTHADRPLTDDVIDSMQSRVDYLGDVFFKCVAKSRGMTPKDVKKLEAGVFLGEEAVESGLADGVLGWYKFLEYVSESLDSPEIAADNRGSEDTESSKETSNMNEKLRLKKAKEEAARKLAAAKSSAERTKLFASYEAAVKAEADFLAKTKYVKKTEERLTKDDGDDDEDDTEETETEESDSEESEEEEESSDMSEEDDEDCSEEASEAEASVGNLSMKSIEQLYNAASKITGKKNVSEICGMLDGMSPRVKEMPKTEQRLQKLEQSNMRAKVRAMLDSAIKDRRITPAQAKCLEPQGMKDPKWLKGYLAAQPPQVRSIEDGPFLHGTEGAPALDKQMLSADQQKMLQTAAQAAGMSVEDYTKELAKHSKTNGAAPRV